jgi:hypothetical protein
MGVVGYLLVARARSSVLTPLPDGRATTSSIPSSTPGSRVATAIAPRLPTGRVTAPPFPPMLQGRGGEPGGAPPFLFPGRINGGRVQPASPGADSAPPVPHIVRTFAVVDLNSASLADLQTLPGITPDYARKIIAARPYRSFREVVERGGIPQAIVEQITPPAILRVMEPAPPKTAAPSAPQRKPQP